MDGIDGRRRLAAGLTLALRLETLALIVAVMAPVGTTTAPSPQKRRSVSPADAQRLIRQAPSIHSDAFRIAPFLVAVEAVQSLGEVRGVAVLEEAAASANTYEEEGKVIGLCRLLFMPKRGREFRRPAIGAPGLLGGTSLEEWPLEPFEVVNGIPFLIVMGYRLGGAAEHPADYLQYCRDNCGWNRYRFRRATEQEMEAALRLLLHSKKWRRPLSGWHRELLTHQVR